MAPLLRAVKVVLSRRIGLYDATDKSHTICLRDFEEHHRTVGPPDSARLQAEFESMKSIPWRDIWKSLSITKIRGNGQRIEASYDTLFKDAVFDDRSAWSIDVKRPH